MKRRFSLLIVIVCAFAFSVLSACGSDDSSSFFDEDDTGLEGDIPGNSSGSDGEGDGKSSGGNSKNSSSSSAHDRLSSVEKIKPSVADSNGSIVDSRDSTVYGTLRQGPYIWMTRNMSKSVYGLYSVCYDADSKNCDKYGRLYVSGAGGVCPDKFRLPTRSEWKEGKKSLSLGLQYGGTCKKLDSLECSGLDSEAFYQVNDGSVFAIYGKETSLFRNSSDYNFYSVRCMAFTHIVHKKSDLPECDSTLRNLPNDFYVTSLDSGYTCGYSGWTIRYNSDRRKCLNVVDTALLYAMGDSTYVCRNNQWQMATLKDVGEICDSTCLDRVVEFNDTKYFCTDSGWSKLTYPSTELGLCKKSNYSRIDLTDKGEKFYCDSTGWTLLTYPETEIGLCVDSIRAKIALTDMGDKFYCDSTGWALLKYPETEIGLCVDSIRTKTVLTSKGDKYICDTTGWRTVQMTDVIGVCNSAAYGKIEEYNGKKYYCDGVSWHVATVEDLLGICDSTKFGTQGVYNDSAYACRSTKKWTILTAVEKEIGLCTESNRGTYGLDEVNKRIYKCDSLKWSQVSETAYKNAFSCASGVRDTLIIFGDGYKCQNGSWVSMLSYEYTIGICTEARVDEVAEAGTKKYRCMYGGTYYQWKALTSQELQMGICPSDNTERMIGRAVFNGFKYYYYCEKGEWKSATYDYLFGACDMTVAHRDTVYDGSWYVCDSTHNDSYTHWHEMTGLDSLGGLCTTRLVGKLVKYKDIIYVCTGVDQAGGMYYTIEEMKQKGLYDCGGEWFEAPDSIAAKYNGQNMSFNTEYAPPSCKSMKPSVCGFETACLFRKESDGGLLG